ncbi:unnamed protein product [Rotaria sp. Silwood2]|nr:unnamed protein product [Rotaria sp. Silwood2]CAF2980401.1 unnamed protein product [Rotaria sp. Silwood2]CAF3329253.1 unnamed protein product [Rotaria sp. Silwood2]CAF3400458.1 unnamed protein product [Rotaria sp. Silwood2]CAF4257286.1 unnamed protein product [Rotaria sp. Silwood2]
MIDSTMNTNIPPKLTTVIADNKVTATEVESVTKRVASDQLEGQVKKDMVDHSLCEERVPSVVTKSIAQPKFISASETAANARASVQTTFEISDEELLEMALKFEIEHPQ